MQEHKKTNAAILSTVEQTLINAASKFERVANGSAGSMDWAAFRMPEFWIVALLMQDLHAIGIAAFPEVRIPDDLDETGTGILSGGQRMTSARYRSILGCKIDLFALDQRDVDDPPVLRAALEVKGPKSNFSEFRRDIERLEALTDDSGDDQQFIFAYATAPLTGPEAEKEESVVRKAVEGGSAKGWHFKTLRCTGDGMRWEDDRRSYVFMAHL